MFEFKSIPIGDIKISDRARKDLGDIKELAEDISLNGLLYPIIVSSELELLAGERRFRATQHLELPLIDCKVLSKVTPAEKLVIELIDNTSRKNFTWSEEVQLKRKIHDQMVETHSGWTYRETCKTLGCSIGGLSSDLEMALVLTSFPQLAELPTKAKARDTYKKLQDRAVALKSVENLSDEDRKRLDEMLGKVPEQKEGVVNGVSTDQTTPPRHERNDPRVTVPTPNTSTSPPALEVEDTSTLPPYTYKICDFKTFLRDLPNEIVGFAELDPPYAIDFNNTYGQTANIKATEVDWSVDKLQSSMSWLFRKLYTKMLDNSWVLCWTGKEHWQIMNSYAAQAGFETQPPGVWVKPSGSGNSPKTTMISQYETFLLMRKGQAQFNATSFPNVISQATVSHSKRGHQWEKPIELYDKFLSACGKPGSVFLSPFAGSGMAMISASLNKMTPMGCDLKQKYLYRFLEVFKDRHGSKQTNNLKEK